jgi:hypothetical protein
MTVNRSLLTVRLPIIQTTAKQVLNTMPCCTFKNGIATAASYPYTSGISKTVN